MESADLTIDISECEREPIHIPGSIQPHGGLLGVREQDLEVVLASANAADLIFDGRTPVGARLDALFDATTVATIRKALEGDPRDANPMNARLADGRAAHSLMHRSDGLLILEIEPAGEDSVTFEAGYRRLVRRFEHIRRAKSIAEVCDVSAHEVRRLVGFDRVMIYQFDQHANGCVISEDHADGMESFLGLHYPASDIPPQARRMYVENPLRIIVDADYRPVLIEPDVNPLTAEPLDLTHASLRSVSPVHCEYLRNMGVAASMSISLVVGEQLWGLIACHHRRPYHVPFGTRLVAEFLAHVLSARISELDRLDSLTRKTEAYKTQARLIDEMIAAPRFQEGLAGQGPTLVDLLECDGAAILHRDEVTRIGATPEVQDIHELRTTVTRDGPGRVFATDCLTELHPPAAQYTDKAAGMIGVPISADGQDLLLWFRGERVRSVTWAGDPNKAVTKQGPGGRLSPRGSFEAWKEEVEGRSEPWKEWEIEVASDFRTALAASVIHQATELERLNTNLIEASQQKDRFLATVSHELRNPLNAIIGWTHVARSGLSEAELEKALNTIERSAEAQSELINDLLDVSQIEYGRLKLETSPVNFGHVLRDALTAIEPAAEAKSIRIEQSAEKDLPIIGDAGRLRQVIWNLLTNSVKFSKPNRRIDVTARREESFVVLTVSDQGVGIAEDFLPHVFNPFRQGETESQRTGLGLGLSIVKSIVELHGGEVDATSDGLGQGATFRVKLPIAALRVPDAGVDREVTHDDNVLDGLTILVVEDHPDALDMVAALLERSGARVLTAANGALGLAILAEESRVHLVVSDLDMPEMNGYELVRSMRSHPDLAEIPTIALTAYTRGGDRARTLNAGFRHHIAKPVHPEELIAVIATVLELDG